MSEHDGGQIGCNHAGGHCSDTPPVAGEPEREALTTRLARLGMSLYDNENKVLIAEAVEALHEAAALIAAGYRRQPEPREVEWGVLQEWGTPYLHVTEESARWYVGEIGGELITRRPASEWTPVTPSAEVAP